MGSLLKEKIIDILRSYGGSYVPQSYIHRAVNASKSRVSEILGELEKEGLISRRSIGRSRVIYVYPGISEREPKERMRKIRIGIVFSSEYLFLPSFLKQIKAKGYEAEIIIFREGLKATKALAEGAVDAAISPLPGQLYLYPMYRTYSIVLNGLSGGFKVLSLGEPGPLYSSMISTMDFIRNAILSRKELEAEGTSYYRSPEEILKLKSRKGFVVTWHPIYIELERRGAKPVLDSSSLEIRFCCTLALSNALGKRAKLKLSKSYLRALRDFERDPGKGIEHYSSLTGIDASILKSATSDYRIVDPLDPSSIDEIVESFAPRIPEGNIYREAVDREALELLQ